MSDKNRITFVLAFGWIVWLLAILLTLIFSPDQSLIPPALVTLGYLLGAFLFTPELAYPSKNQLDPIKWWGRFGFIWTPYRSYFKKRTVWSHGYIVSATLQVLYLSAISLSAYSLAYAIASFLPLSLPPAKEVIVNLLVSIPSNPGILMSWLFGVWAGNGIHLFIESKGWD